MKLRPPPPLSLSLALSLSLRRDARFLTFVSGRGLFYLFVGSLALAQWPLVPEALAGAWLVALGVAYVGGARGRGKALDTSRPIARARSRARPIARATDRAIATARSRVSAR